MTLVMLDSTNVADLPASGMDAVAGYVGGNWTTWPALVARFPNLPKLSIAVNSHEDAQCLDVESGDAAPALVPAWLDRQHSLRPGETQIIYCPASWIPAVRTAAGSRKYLLWSAHYEAGQHRCGPGACQYEQADATQWDDHGPNGEHYDRTVMLPAFLAAIEATQPTQAAPPPVLTKPTPAPAPKPAPKPTSAPAPKPAPAKGLTVNVIDLRNAAAHTVTGPGVVPMQRLLGVVADGKAGPMTRGALGAAQIRAFGHADFIFGPQTAEALLAGK